MKNYRFYLALFLIVGSVLVVAALLDAGTRRGHAQGRTGGKIEKSGVRTTAAVRSSSSSMSPAAARNASLSAELNWTFGAKPQRGWYIYAPLINHLLHTDHDVASEGFASALAGWQKKSNLTPTGVLEQDSLYAMVSEWQGKRLKEKTPARPDQLVTAPVSDFYDPSRLDELRQVERETYAAYKRMVAAAISDKSLALASAGNEELAAGEKYLKIISAFRSREYQDKLRRESPNAGRAGLAVNSPHFTGRALDLYVGGEPVETKDANRAIQIQTPVYQWLVRNAERFGFRPYYYEPWHWEYVGR